MPSRAGRSRPSSLARPIVILIEFEPMSIAAATVGGESAVMPCAYLKSSDRVARLSCRTSLVAAGWCERQQHSQNERRASEGPHGHRPRPGHEESDGETACGRDRGRAAAAQDGAQSREASRRGDGLRSPTIRHRLLRAQQRLERSQEVVAAAEETLREVQERRAAGPTRDQD